MRKVWVVLCLAGCKQVFGIDDPTLVRADAAGDHDAGICTTVSSECADENTLRTCQSVGTIAVDTTCAWGCVATGSAHCGQLVPGGGGVIASDLVPETLSDLTLQAVTIDGDAGTITGVSTGFEHVARTGISVFRFKSLHLAGSVTLVGAKSIALVADGAIVIDDMIDARGGCVGTQAGPGGFAGGANNLSGIGPGGGSGGSSTSQGGGGGGHGGRGGAGGAGVNSPPGGPIYGDAAISMLVGGSGGGCGGGGGGPPVGGGGGGAIQLASNAQVAIRGGINAGGCGGAGASNADGGAGGGAGGAILIEAPVVTVNGVLAVNGGGGGAGNGGTRGNHGTADRVRATGGTSTSANPGGFGGAGSFIDGAAGAGTNPGGGGGAVGRIRINTRSGNATIGAAAVLSPSFADPSTTCSQGTATIQ